MLPSFRLIALTFLCGFAAMFAGLRLAASLNDFHEGLPVMSAAHAAPVAIADAADQRGGALASPVIYDWRFAVRSGSQAPAPVNVTALVIDRAAPLDVTPPRSIVPAEQIAKEAPVSVEPANAEPAKPTDSVAAIVPEPSTVEPAKASVTQPDAPAVAAVDPQATPAGERAPRAAEAAPDVAPAPEVNSTAAEASPVAAADPQPGAPAVAPEPSASAAKPAPRVVARKRRVRVAQRATPANPAPSLNGTSTSPFGAPR